MTEPTDQGQRRRDPDAGDAAERTTAPGVFGQPPTFPPESAGQTPGHSTTGEGPSASQEPPAEPDGTARAWGRFTLLRPHARGGLGQISVARDEDLHRQVALKEIRPELDSPLVRQRFLNEAQITGQLEHPGVVPIYALGHDEHGEPYYAMRLIQGQTLAEAIAAYHRRPSALAFRDLLRRLVDVCQTIAYAHSKGVIHRDLKPANVMVGEYGETLVLDWGLAKRIAGPPAGADAPETPADAVATTEGPLTQAGQLLGTPVYMAPEQAEGRHEGVGPAADVYGLGVILYELLTGRPPYRGSARDILDQLRAGSPPRPSQVRRQTPRALEAVCLKAMARRPEDRYGSARELAQDVERWLADEPVSAWREPRAVKARRWMKRHRTLVTSGTLLLLAAVVALGFLAFLSDRARRHLLEEQARTQEQRRRAQGNLQQALTAIDRMLSRVGEKRLAHVPQFDQERRAILEDALGLFRGLLDENSDEPEVRLQTGRAYRRMGDINLLLAKNEEAERAYGRARVLLADLAEEHPGVADYRHALAEAHTGLGRLCYRMGRWEEAETAYRKAQTLLEGLVRSAPDERQYGRDLGASHNDLGALYRDTGRLDEAEAEYRKFLEAREELAEAHPDVAEYQSDLAAAHNNLGLLASDRGKTDQAEAAYREAAAVWDELVRQHPSEPEYRSASALTSYNLGRLYVRVGKYKPAEEAHKKALGLWEKLAAAHPSVAQHRRWLANSHTNLAWLYQLTDRPAEAEAALKKALTLQEELHQRHPEVPEYQRELAYTHGQLGWLYQNTKRTDEARRHYKECLAHREELAGAHPDVPDYQSALGWTYHNLGMFHVSLKETAEAEAAYQKALGIREKLAARHTEVPDYQNDLAWTYNNLATVYSHGGETDKAREAHEKALAVREKLARDHRDVVDYQVGLVATYSNLGKLSREAGDPGASLAWEERAVPILEKVLEKAPGHAQARQFLCTSHWGRGEAYALMKEYAKAREAYDLALSHDRGRYRAILRYQRALVVAHLGDHAAVAAAAEKMTEGKAVPGVVLYRAASLFAVAAGAAGKDTDLPPAEREQVAEGYADRAVGLLTRAREADFFRDAAHVHDLKSNPSFDALRSRADFRKLVGERMD